MPPAGRHPAGPATALLVFLVAVLSGSSVSVSAQSARRGPSGITEYDVKAVYLYNFARYFTWPKNAFASARAPLVIGVLGDGRLGAALAEVARKKTVKGRRITVRRLKSLKEYRPCHILFLPRAAEQAVHTAAIAQTRRSPLLLVGETRGFAARGATVNFYPDVDGTIGFEINVDAAALRKLRVDARLLKLAKVVKSSPQSGGGE